MRTNAQVKRSLLKIRIASPCSADWARMSGDEKVRHCAECNLNVYNLSSMSVGEVETLLTKTPGRLCVRFYRRADGKVLTQDCPRGVRLAVRKMSRISGMVLSAIMSVASTAVPAQAKPPVLVQIEQQRGGIVVLVLDPQGAVVANARIAFRDERNTWSVVRSTGQNGELQLLDLPFGTYIMEVSAPGFEVHREVAQVNKPEPARIEVKLNLMQLQGEVVVATTSSIEPEMAWGENLQMPSYVSAPTQRMNPVKRFFLKIGKKLVF